MHYGSHVEYCFDQSFPYRDKASYPYSYDPFFTHGTDHYGADGADAQYSDRLRNYPNYREVLAKHFTKQGDYWNNVDTKKLSAFLSDLYGKPVKCTAVGEGCNVGNGYPYWIFWTKPVKK